MFQLSKRSIGRQSFADLTMRVMPSSLLTQALMTVEVTAGLT
jgi:hypothetical protein